MLYLRQSPAPPLGEFVDCFWLCEGGQTLRKERILPSGTIELVVNLREDEMRIYDPAQPERYRRFPGAVLSGTYSQVFVCDAMQHESIVGVHFKPGGAFPFLGAAANELADAHSDLADLWGRPALELRERLCGARTPRERFQILQEFLAGRLNGSSAKRHATLPLALDRFGEAGTGASVRDVAREAGLCQRRLIQVFTAQVGLTPKLFCRVLRFQRVRALVEQTEAGTVDWAQLALACGYFDQSHLINDFQEFSGCSPTAYMRQKQQERLLRNHVALAA